MKSIHNIKNISDIKNRAKELSVRKDYIMLYSREDRFYMEVYLNNQIKMIEGESGSGKTYFLNTLQELIRNNAIFDIKNIDEKRISVMMNPEQIGGSPKYSDIWFIDRGDMLTDYKAAMLNKHLRKGNMVMICAKLLQGVKSEIPAYGDKFTVKVIDGVSCFFLE